MEHKPSIFPARIGILFLLPALFFVAIFLIFPFIWVIIISFTNQTLTGATAANPQFVGLENYARLFDFSRWMRSGEFGASLLITVQFVLGSALIGQAGLGLLIAVLFYRRKGWARRIVTTLAVLAWIIPEVVVAFAWFAYLDRDSGTLNMILSALGLGKPDWLFDYPLLSIIIFNTWRGSAFSMLLFQSALETIPPSYIETADVAGASAWQKFRDILVPLLRGHIATDLILITLWTFNVFTPYLLTGGGPTNRTQLVSIYTYKTAFQFFRFGQGAAIAVVMMFINLTLALIYLSTLRRQRVDA
ncbi:MAG: sugar ABC transporter permease [Chloroflexota bacterium]|nr:MAG: ABC transporter permease [Chloroflexota bacterium]